jgi:hypothetical protein
MKIILTVVALALAVTATAAANVDPGTGGGPSGRSQAQDRLLIPGGGLSEGGVRIDNPKRAIPWGRSGNVWQTTTRNIVCRYESAPPPTIECMTRNDGFLAMLGRVAITDYELVGFLGVPDSAPILRWGQYVRRGSFRCISRRVYLSCFNLRTRNGFELSKTKYAGWNHPRWSPYPPDEAADGLNPE